MKHTYFIVAAMLGISLLAAACSPEPTEEPTVAPISTSVPTVSASSSAAMSATATTGTASSMAASATSGVTSSMAVSGTTSSMAASGMASSGMPAATRTPAAAVTIMVNQTGTAGTYLVDGQGFALYGYSKDTQNQPGTCTGDCAKDWPPVLITGAAATAGNGVDATKLGVGKNINGVAQVTYNGWPLYYFAKDMQPGDAKGNGVGGFFLITPAGTPLH